MDKVSLAAVLLIGAVVGLGVWQMSQSCAWSSTTKESPEGSPEGTGETRCEQKYAVTPFVFLGIMVLAAVGIALTRAPLAWGAAVSALAACTIFGLSWGGALFFHAVATVGIVALWHVSSPVTKASRVKPSIVAAVLSIPLAAFGLFAVATSGPALLDPCHEWGDGGSHGQVSMPADGECRSVTSSPLSRGDYAFQLATQHGLAVVAGVLAVLGAWRGRALLLAAAGLAWLVVAAAWMLGFGLPFIPFALLAGLSCLAAAWRLRVPPAPGPPAPSAP